MGKKTLSEIKSELRCLVISSAKEINVETLQRDYYNEMGSPIPFIGLGFKTLLDFLKSIPDTIGIVENGRNAIVRPVLNVKVEHINNMVKRQKKPRCNLKSGAHGNYRKSRNVTNNKQRHAPKMNYQRSLQQQSISTLSENVQFAAKLYKANKVAGQNDIPSHYGQPSIITPMNDSNYLKNCMGPGQVIPISWPVMFKKNEQFDLTVCGLLDNTAKFWFRIQHKHFSDLFNDMTSKMEILYQLDSAIYSMPRSVIQIGMFCVVAFGETWKRAEIKHIVDSETVEVFFCDSGAASYVSMQHLYSLNNAFSCLPQQAFRGQLEYVNPIGTETSTVLERLTKDKLLNACVSEADIEHQLLWLVLLDPSNKLNINEELITRSVANLCLNRKYLPDPFAKSKRYSHDKEEDFICMFQRNLLIGGIYSRRLAAACSAKDLKGFSDFDSSRSLCNTEYASKPDTYMNSEDEKRYCALYYKSTATHNLMYDDYDPCKNCQKLQENKK